MRKVTDFMIQVANRKTFVAALILYLVFGAGVMPWGASKFAALSGKEKVEIMDLQVTGYDVAKAAAILQEYSREARLFAAKFGLIADSLYPLAYTWLYLLTFAWILKNSRSDSSLLRLAFIFPILTMLIDFVENHYIGALMYGYPGITAEQVATASLLTKTKWVLFAVQTITLLALIGQLIAYRMQKRTAA